MSKANPTSVEDLTRAFSQAKLNSDGSLAEVPISQSVAPAEVYVDGFVSTVARDIFSATGRRDLSERADELAKVLGEDLYKEVKFLAGCQGKDDESHWLTQYLWLRFERDQVRAEGIDGKAKPFAQDVDGTPGSKQNQALAKYLSPSILGRLLQASRSVTPRVSIPAVLQKATSEICNEVRKQGL